MPIDKISLSDPFAYEESNTAKGAPESNRLKLKRSPKTISYSTKTVNSESDVTYIRQGIYQNNMQTTLDFIPLTKDTIKQTDQGNYIPKNGTIGSKTYFMHRMIIACENLEQIKPIRSHSQNQSLPSEE